MKNVKSIKSCFLLLVMVVGINLHLSAQEVENDFQTRTSVNLSFKPIKDLKISFSPELRFVDNLQFDQYLFEGEATYSPIKHFEFGASYRFKGNKTGSGDYNNKNKYAVYIEIDKKLDRFTPSVKISYTNSSDDEFSSKFLRYKASVNYNIRKSKLTPEIGVEFFHDLGESNFYKVRYMTGLDYKLFKNNSISIDYKLDYYLQEYRNKNIVSIGYKIKF